MSLSKSRKRSYRYRVKCAEYEKEFDSDYVEAHSRIVHSGRKVKCPPVVESSHLSCSPNLPRASITRYTHAEHEQILKSCCSLIILFFVVVLPERKRSIC